MHTNNYTEAWHKVLKTKYIPPPERKRIDEVVHILSGAAEPNLRWAELQVNESFVGQTTNRFQNRAKILGESYCSAALQTLGIRVFKHPTHVSCCYLRLQPTRRQKKQVAYARPASSSKYHLTRCTCMHFQKSGSACKHMFYIAREFDMLVVEGGELDSRSVQEPIDIEGLDSDIEVVGPGGKFTPRKRRLGIGHGADTSMPPPKARRCAMDADLPDFARRNLSPNTQPIRRGGVEPVEPVPLGSDRVASGVRSYSIAVAHASVHAGNAWVA